VICSGGSVTLATLGLRGQVAGALPQLMLLWGSTTGFGQFLPVASRRGERGGL
jgi:hypothetical protein